MIEGDLSVYMSKLQVYMYKDVPYHRVKEHVNGIIGQHHFGNTDIFDCFTVQRFVRT